MSLNNLLRTGRNDIPAYLTYAIAGVVLGNIVNKLHKETADKFIQHFYLRSAVKVLITGAVLFFLETNLAPAFIRDWQITTPGLLAMWYFFSLQTSMMGDLAQLANFI